MFCRLKLLLLLGPMTKHHPCVCVRFVEVQRDHVSNGLFVFCMYKRFYACAILCIFYFVVQERNRRKREKVEIYIDRKRINIGYSENVQFENIIESSVTSIEEEKDPSFEDSRMIITGRSVDSSHISSTSRLFRDLQLAFAESLSAMHL